MNLCMHCFNNLCPRRKPPSTPGFKSKVHTQPLIHSTIKPLCGMPAASHLVIMNRPDHLHLWPQLYLFSCSLPCSSQGNEDRRVCLGLHSFSYSCSLLILTESSLGDFIEIILLSLICVILLYLNREGFVLPKKCKT